MGIIKKFPPVKELREAQKAEIEARLKYEAEIDDFLEKSGRPLIYRSASELLKLDPKPPFCMFCGKGVNQVSEMIGENDTHICNQCIVFCYETILMTKKNINWPE